MKPARKQLICPQRKLSAFCILFLVSFLVACGSTKKAVKPPEFEIVEATLSKQIIDKDTKGIASEPALAYSTSDEHVVSYVKLKNLSGKHKIRWDWFTPDGELYYTTGHESMETKENEYIKEASAWHKLSIKGDKAENFPGNWLVKIYYDNQIIASNTFTLEMAKTVPGVEPDSKKWGLIIGIENYSQLPVVQFAERDTRLVKECFINIMEVPEENIIYLFDDAATKSRIEGYLKDYLPMNVEKETILYVYFAGHGIPSLKDNDAYLIPSDGDPRFIERTGYKLEKFYKDLNALKIKRSVVFIDGCFTGVASRNQQMLLAGARPALIHTKPIKLDATKVISLTASSGKQISNSYPKKEHGLFTYYLTEGLNGHADSNNDQLVSVIELYQYLKQNVNKTSRRMGVEQTPQIMPSADAVEDVSIGKIVR